EALQVQPRSRQPSDSDDARCHEGKRRKGVHQIGNQLGALDGDAAASYHAADTYKRENEQGAKPGGCGKDVDSVDFARKSTGIKRLEYGDNDADRCKSPPDGGRGAHQRESDKAE